MTDTPERNEAIEVSGHQNVRILEELAELYGRWRREIWVGVLEDSLLPIRIKVVDNNNPVIAARSAQLSLLLEINVVGAVFMSPGCLLTETFL